MKIRISADSTCDLSPEILEKYNIGIIASLPVKNWAERKLADHEGIRAWGSALLALILLALSFLQLISSTFNPFIYYRF